MSTSARTNENMVAILRLWAKNNDIEWRKVVNLFAALSMVNRNRSFTDSISGLYRLVQESR